MSLPTIQNPFAPAQPTFEDELCSMCPSMTYQQRLIGFCICCGCGYASEFHGHAHVTIQKTLKKRVTNFAILYVFGNRILLRPVLNRADGSARRCSPKLEDLPASSGCSCSWSRSR